MNSPVKIWRNHEYVRALLFRYGEVLSWTVIRVPPGTHSAYAPYVLAIIKLESGEKITVPLMNIDTDSVQIGLKVKTVLRRLMPPDADGVIQYGIKAVPAL